MLRHHQRLAERPGNGNMQNADGTSNTLMFSEALVGNNKGNESNRRLGIDGSTPGSHDRGNGIVIGSTKNDGQQISESFSSR